MAGFTVQNQFLGLATSVDAQSVQSPNDGIMGQFSVLLSITWLDVSH